MWKIHSGIFLINPKNKETEDQWLYTPEQASEYEKQKNFAGDELWLIKLIKLKNFKL